ncbi:MAG TPA: 4Fe-4S binding protein [Candidatus Acidoferrum sp.]|jgi:polyferredoxin
MASHISPTAIHDLVDVPIDQILPASTRRKLKKKLDLRIEKDRSQLYRKTFQFTFLALNLWLGAKFFFWVRQFETGNLAENLRRPAGVEGWLPIAGLMNLKFWILSGHIPQVHPAAMFLLITFLAMSFLLSKAFCSWLCPVGTVSEYLWRLGKTIFGRNFLLPRWVDLPLRSLKYLLLGFFAWAISTMSVVGIREVMESPYGLIADVKMLNFFRHIGETGLVVLGIFVLASVLVQNFWCRFLCPYGALLGMVAFFSPARIRRNASSCIDCAKCAKACPSSLPVDKLASIKSVECTGCLECVAVCPSQSALRIGLPLLPEKKTVAIPSWAMAAAIAVLFFGIVGFAQATGHWNSAIPNAAYEVLVPHADQAAHPMPK